MLVRHWLCAALVASALAAAPAAAQPREEELSGQALYHAQLADLSRVLGGAHYLRLTCSDGRDYRWYRFMETLLSQEGAQRRVMADAFNDGFRGQRARFAQCTRDATAMEAELRAQGMRLADGLGAANGD
jgi:uncharacterized protein (TIGR02301 family)